MGRPNPVLTLVVYDMWYAHPAIQTLIDEGHEVYKYSQHPIGEDGAPDAIIHPAAHGWHETMFDFGENSAGKPTAKRPYVEAMKVAARKRRKERKS